MTVNRDSLPAALPLEGNDQSGNYSLVIVQTTADFGVV